MKKAHAAALVAVTALFAAFTLGFFLGRNQDRTNVILSVPAAMQTEPALEILTENSVQGTGGSAGISYPININAATREEFTSLPGIGDVLAQRIIAYRSRNGHFSSVEELTNVEGIGTKRLESILHLITTGG